MRNIWWCYKLGERYSKVVVGGELMIIDLQLVLPGAALSVPVNKYTQLPSHTYIRKKFFIPGHSDA